MAQTFASTESLRAAGRRVENINLARTAEVIRDPQGRVIPEGARVAIKYAGHKTFDIAWGDKRDNRLPIAVKAVPEDKLNLLVSR